MVAALRRSRQGPESSSAARRKIEARSSSWSARHPGGGGPGGGQGGVGLGQQYGHVHLLNKYVLLSQTHAALAAARSPPAQDGGR